MAARHGGTVVQCTTAPDHTSATPCGAPSTGKGGSSQPSPEASEDSGRGGPAIIAGKRQGRPVEAERVKSPRGGERGECGAHFGASGGGRDDRSQPGRGEACGGAMEPSRAGGRVRERGSARTGSVEPTGRTDQMVRPNLSPVDQWAKPSNRKKKMIIVIKKLFVGFRSFSNRSNC